MQSKQNGVGMVEVLVALILLAIAVLGFVGLQIRAVAASHEAGRNVQAMNIARDLSERIRVNRDGLLHYEESDSDENCGSGASGVFCTSEEMANYDFNEVNKNANALGMQIAINDCQGTAALSRKCIYVAWEGTTPTNGVGSPNCTNGVAYVPEAKCIIVEVYNYD
ncbi:type IV pilus modification protein PilV [Acinetobacter haemolyticus]|uniref:type IV pilus modification protein PilV n=1 Tax=Acinetobacter haemolyticus TaxID=29430 RepID=UPI0021CD6817|nr:type IV pilus modification protein PilV [Acinetobacter haemolyticus]MCU4378588.1 type IV pilus modification protein PilV [Acinetobacter haemolyticus]